MQYCILRWCRNFKYKRTEKMILYTIIFFIVSMCMFQLTNCQIERNFKVVVRFGGWGELTRETFVLLFPLQHNRNWICLHWLYFSKKVYTFNVTLESMSNHENIRWNTSVLVQRNYSLCTSHDIYVYQHIFSYKQFSVNLYDLLCLWHFIWFLGNGTC